MDLADFMVELKNQQENFIQNLSSLNEKRSIEMDDLKSLMKGQNDKLNCVFTNTKDLFSSQNYLQARVKFLEVKIEENEQFKVKNMVEIEGVPQHQNEDLVGVVCAIGSGLGIEMTKSMIDDCYRIRKNKNIDMPRTILVRFVRYLDKVMFLNVWRAKKPPASVFRQGDCPRVLVKDCLTSGNTRLLTAAKMANSVLGYKYVWVQNGRVLMRADEQSPYVRIRSDSDLSKLLSELQIVKQNDNVTNKHASDLSKVLPELQSVEQNDNITKKQ